VNRIDELRKREDGEENKNKEEETGGKLGRIKMLTTKKRLDARPKCVLKGRRPLPRRYFVHVLHVEKEEKEAAGSFSEKHAF
jgi:hypothetical protein